MDYSRFFGGEEDPPRPSPKKELQLQGPRPTPLRVSKDSHTIKKPPRHPPPHPAAAPPHGAAASEDRPRKPVIIYDVSPKVIHVKEGDFMSLVQRLTGLSPTGPRAGDVSPAARFASIEKASPSHKLMGNNSMVGVDQAMMGSVEGVEGMAGRESMPGILSPAPASLPVIPSGFFSPVTDAQTVPLFQDLTMSPLLHGAFLGGSSGIVSPSAWFSAPMISPSPTSLDLYSLFAEF